ncbi:hypothetical protein, partial [Klebsiella pneumoniae]|uniref:hypothetical protein n=1 Tax=Klebsiella pneumoniae TaxID=573 RepID=UPI00396877EC
MTDDRGELAEAAVRLRLAAEAQGQQVGSDAPLLLGAGLGVVGQLGFHRGDFLGQGQQVADAH